MWLHLWNVMAHHAQIELLLRVGKQSVDVVL
jgi:hypothetical protein